MRTARAFSPAGISSFFEICDTKADGKPIRDLEHIGSRGGGFVIEKGVITEVSVEEADRSRIEVYINRELAPEADTTRSVITMMLRKISGQYSVIVHHKLAVPIGAGFGTSAAGALSTVLALSKAMNINLTLFQAGRIAHVAEVKCRTGLGTVGPVALGGCVITLEPGAPGYAVIDRIPTESDHVIVAGCYRPVLTKEVLSSTETRRTVNRYGKETVSRILADPSLENFMQTSKEFALNAGFATPITKKLIGLAEKEGAIGASQNMVGEAVHALTTVHEADGIAEVFRKVLPTGNILTAKIDAQGARLLS